MGKGDAFRNMMKDQQKRERIKDSLRRKARVNTNHIPHVNIGGVMKKSCSKCGSLKPADNEHFHNDKHTFDGLKSFCKECSK